MKIHELKIEQQYLDNLKEGRKKSEIRFNDRDYQVGDILEFKEYPGSKGIVKIQYRIMHIHSGLGMEKGYVVLSLDTHKTEAEDEYIRDKISGLVSMYHDKISKGQNIESEYGLSLSDMKKIREWLEPPTEAEEVYCRFCGAVHKHPGSCMENINKPPTEEYCACGDVECDGKGGQKPSTEPTHLCVSVWQTTSNNTILDDCLKKAQDINETSKVLVAELHDTLKKSEPSKECPTCKHEYILKLAIQAEESWKAKYEDLIGKWQEKAEKIKKYEVAAKEIMRLCESASIASSNGSRIYKIAKEYCDLLKG